MKSSLCAGWVLCFIAGLSAAADIKLGDQSLLVFASMAEGRELLGQRDDFVQCLSPFDRAARLKTNREVSAEEFLKFATSQARDWTVGEQQKVQSALAETPPLLAAISGAFPAKILLVKTTGEEEGHAAYTRGRAIMLPKDEMAGTPQALRKLIWHELFHVLTRTNPKLRDVLYETIGFAKCDEIELPVELKSRRITNPDAPWNDHCIRIQVDGQAAWAVPVLYARAAKYDLACGGEFFDYLVFKFLLVDRGAGGLNARPVVRNLEPLLIDPAKVSGFYEQVGRNTSYILHPEEILADNFVLLLQNRDKVASPQVLNKLREVLKQAPRP